MILIAGLPEAVDLVALRSVAAGGGGEVLFAAPPLLEQTLANPNELSGALVSDTTNTATGNRDVAFSQDVINGQPPPPPLAASQPKEASPGPDPGSDGHTEGKPTVAEVMQQELERAGNRTWNFYNTVLLGHPAEAVGMYRAFWRSTAPTNSVGEVVKGGARVSPLANDVITVGEDAHKLYTDGANMSTQEKLLTGVDMALHAASAVSTLLGGRSKIGRGGACSGSGWKMGPSCFVAGTAIQTPNGTKPIEDLEPGDLVVSLDPEAQPGVWQGADVRRASREESVSERDPSFTGASRAPALEDVVLVLAAEAKPAEHRPLIQVDSGARVAFQGRIYETRRRGEAMELRKTGETLQRVAKVFRRATERLVQVTIRSKQGEHRVVGTPEHPFFVPARHGFVPMGELAPGVVLLGEGGAAGEVVRVEEQPASSEVFNFEVERTHTYYVCDAGGSGCELVHNTCELEAIVRELLGANGGISASLKQLSAMKLGQGKTIKVLEMMYNATGRGTGGVVTLPNGSKVLLSRMLGARRPVLVVAPNTKRSRSFSPDFGRSPFAADL